MKAGPAVGRPLVDTLKGSRHASLKELRIQHAGRPYRVLFAFDRRRIAILLLGGVKADAAFYKRILPKAEQLLERHLRTLEQEERDRD